ncbi:MAG TPA: SRPBCC family protein, partial [Terriglobales bacterium]|nr:SRPBCC family protein [Terriglobales bacterium]
FELEKTIRIDAPLSDVFDFWANPENYPGAFSHVSNIERLGENLYRWRLIGPSKIAVTWEGVITRVISNTLIEWKSLPGSSVGNFGIVRFDPLYDGSTRVHIRMFYRPPAGILGQFIAEFLGADPNKILDQDLNQLKRLFEDGGPSTKSRSSSNLASAETEARESVYKG